MTSLEFVNPLTGGPAVTTFACEMHRLYPELVRFGHDLRESKTER